MSLVTLAHADLDFLPVIADPLKVPATELGQSWDSLAYEIRRLFKAAIANCDQGNRSHDGVVIAAERILDATASLAEHAELEGDPQRARLLFSLEQCEAEAQRLFDAYLLGQPAPVLSAYAERGLIAAYGLQDMFVSALQ